MVMSKDTYERNRSKNQESLQTIAKKTELLNEIHKIGEEYYSVDHSTCGVSFYEYLARRLVEVGYLSPEQVAEKVKDERERARPYLEDAIEVLDNAQGEWRTVTGTYSPDWTHPLKEAVTLIGQALSKEK